MSDNDPPQAPRGDPAAPEVIDGIRTLHARIDELHRMVAQRLETQGVHAGEWLHEESGALHLRTSVPAWRRRTQGEIRWPVTITVAAAIALQVAVPGRLVLVTPTWILPAVQGALLLAIVAANPHRIDRQSKFLRMLSLTLAALLTFANIWSVAKLAVDITHGKLGGTPGQLLITGGAIWLTNIVVFGLWYWEFDRSGPVARALSLKNRYPDFQFPQMVSPPEMVPPDRRDAHVAVGEGGDDRAVAHLDRDRRPGRLARGQHPASHLTRAFAR
jgi:hypothetical protein